MATSLKFGTSGLRGLSTDLAGSEARRYAAAFARYSGGRGPIFVGRDLRASSPRIAADVISAISALGINIVNYGELPTPALALAAMANEAPAVMVTGSHIPADRNGLKFYLPTGEIDKDDEAGIVAQLGEAPVGDVEVRVDETALASYRDRYLHALPHRALAGWRVGVWQHSSVARDLIADVVEGFGAEAVALGRSDTFIPVDTEAVSEDMATELAGWVHAHQLDALVSTDGDADRPLIVDDSGALIRGDAIGILTARFVGADVVVTPVTSNSSIEGMGAFRKVVRTRVGSPYVIAGMAEAGTGEVVVGFEANGGVLLGSDVSIGGVSIARLPTRDALLPILAVLGAARAAETTLSALTQTLPQRFARSGRLENVPPEQSARLIARLETDAAGFLAPQGRIASRSSIDGPRFELASGEVIHYRPSGNAPELRCYTEASTAERADELLAWGLKAAGAVVR